MNQETYMECFLPFTSVIDGIIENYLINSKKFFKDTSNNHRLFAFQEPRIVIPEPRINIWAFVSRNELEEIMKLKNNTDIKSRLGL